MRRLLIALHKYTGLVTGLLLALIGITGSLLVFDHALDEVLAPRTVPGIESGPPAPLQKVIEAARAAVPGQLEPYRIYLARQPGSPHIVRFREPPGAPGPIEVSVAPVSTEVLAVRHWGQYTMTWLYRLHYTLLAGTIGEYVVGISGLFLLFFCLSGLYLWWPRPGRWRRALTIKRGSGPFRLNFDLHNTVGFYFLPVVIAVAFSGVCLVFKGPTQALMGAILPMEARPSPQSEPDPGAEPLTVDQAVARARAVFPDAELKRVNLPGSPAASYRLDLNQPGEPWTTHAASAVWIDQYSGTVLASWDALDLPAGSTFMTWQFPLHNGDILGLTGRWLVFLSGLTPTLLFGTGVYLWWRKRSRPRKRSSAPGPVHG